jgi:hypothetical protein
MERIADTDVAGSTERIEEARPRRGVGIAVRAGCPPTWTPVRFRSARDAPLELQRSSSDAAANGFLKHGSIFSWVRHAPREPLALAPQRRRYRGSRAIRRAIFELRLSILANYIQKMLKFCFKTRLSFLGYCFLLPVAAPAAQPGSLRAGRQIDRQEADRRDRKKLRQI